MNAPSPTLAVPDFAAVFDAVAGAALLLLPDAPRFTVVNANQDFVALSGNSPDSIVGQSVFSAFGAGGADEEVVENLSRSFHEIIASGAAQKLPARRFDVPDEQGSLKRCYWAAINRPVKNKAGAVAYILHSIVDETARYQKEEQEISLKNLRHLEWALSQSSVLTMVFKGEDLIIEYANDLALQTIPDGRKILGEPLTRAMPELADQDYPRLLREVMRTGKAYHAAQSPALLMRGGKPTTVYYNLSYQRYMDPTRDALPRVLTVGVDVTQWVQAQQQLKESETRFRHMVQQAPVVMVVLRGENFLFDVVNDAMLHHFKLDPSVIGKPVLEVFPELATQPVWNLVQEVYHQGKSHFISNYPVEIKLNGQKQTRYYTSSYVPLKENSKVVGVLQTLIDVTDAVLAQKEIEQREHMFRSLVQQAPFAAAFYKGRDLVVDVANPAMLRIWGRDASVIGLQLKDALPELAGQQYLDLLEQVYASGKEHIGDEEPGQLDRDGKLDTFYFNYSYKPLVDTTGQVYGILNTAIEVTDQVRARKALEENEVVLQAKVAERTEQLATANQSLAGAHDYLQQIINRFEEAICSLQPVFESNELVDFRFGMVNARYTKYAAGQSPESLQGKMVGEVFPGHHSTYTFEVYKEVYHTGEPRRFEQHYNTNGLDIYLVTTVTKMGNEVVAHFNDITELKTLQLDLLEKIKELERSNRNLEEFAHAASHDLKEPIRKVQFFTNRLKEQLSVQEDGDRYTATFGRIENAATRMGLLIDDLLTYSHVSHRPHQKEPVQLTDVLHRVLEDLELDIQQRQASIDVVALPVVPGFKRQLQQMFQNLVANALKYSREGVAPHLRIYATTAERQGKQWQHISVADNGIGFEQEYAEKIFQMFTRLHGKNEYGGTGIGLSIVRKVVDNHGGIVEAESTPGVGATFHIYLPLEE